MIERLFVVAALAAAVVAGVAALRAWRAWRLRRLAADAPFSGLVPAGRPAVVAFSTPSCAECRTRQAPALRRLAESLGDQAVIASLSALEHPELVDRVGILTVPATVVLDARGGVRQVNLGFVDERRLASQVLGAQA